MVYCTTYYDHLLLKSFVLCNKKPTCSSETPIVITISNLYGSLLIVVGLRRDLFPLSLHHLWLKNIWGRGGLHPHVEGRGAGTQLF